MPVDLSKKGGIYEPDYGDSNYVYYFKNGYHNYRRCNEISEHYDQDGGGDTYKEEFGNPINGRSVTRRVSKDYGFSFSIRNLFKSKLDGECVDIQDNGKKRVQIFKNGQAVGEPKFLGKKGDLITENEFEKN